MRRCNSELPLRLALLGLFKSRLIDSDHYFLTEKETGRFHEFCTRIVLHVADVVAEKPPRRLVLGHTDKAAWRAEQPMAA